MSGHKTHFELAKKMINDKKFDLHHEMSEKLQKVKTKSEFNKILKEYEGRLAHEDDN